MSTSTSLQSSLLHSLQTQKSLFPTQSWLTTFLSTQSPSTPLPALTSSANFRLLASDITTTLATSPSTTLPPGINNPRVASLIMTGAIVVQVLDIEDLSKSRWEQIEAIEALERGEGTKGREIIRVNAAEVEEQESARRTKSEGPHKLLLQDAAGMKVYGLEVKDVDGLGVKMPMGSKLVLKNAEVARGMILLEGETCKFLGGQIQAVDRAWKEGRKKALKGAIEREREMEER